MRFNNGETANVIMPALEQLGKKELPVLTALKLRKVLRSFRERAADLNSLRNDFLQEWGKKDRDGKVIVSGGGQVTVPKGEAALAYGAAMAELYGGEWEYDGALILEADLGSIRVAPTVLADLGDLICVNGEGPEEK